MAGAQNSSYVSSILSDKFIPKVFTKSKKKEPTEVFNRLNIKKLFERINLYEKKPVRLCLQFMEKRNLQPQKYVCLKTKYVITPLPSNLKENSDKDADIDRASVLVQPSSIQTENLSEKRMKNIQPFDFNQNQLSQKRKNLNQEDYKSKYDTTELKCLYSGYKSNTKTCKKDNQKEKVSNNLQTKSLVIKTETECKKDKKPKQNTKPTLGNSTEIPNNKSMGKKLKKKYRTKHYNNRVEKNDLKNCKPVKSSSYLVNNHRNRKLKSSDIEQNKKIEPKKIYPCNKIKTGKQTLPKNLESENKIENTCCKSGSNKGIVTIEGKQYKAIVCVANNGKNKTQNYNMEQLLSDGDVEVLLRHPTEGDVPISLYKPKELGQLNHDESSNEEEGRSDNEYKNSKLKTYTTARPDMEINRIPGFSFRLNKLKEIDKSNVSTVNNNCLIQLQEEQRFEQKQKGHQPLTIIMNEPFNTSLRIYEVTLADRKRHKKSTK